TGYRTGTASKWMLMIYTAGVVLLVVAGRNIVESATVVLGWAIASIVAAVLLTPLVGFLDRFLPRALAFVLVLLAVAAVGLGVRAAYVAELQGQVDYLAAEGPEIAKSVEARQDRVGDVAREIELVDRVTELTERLQERIGTPSDVLRDAAMAVPAYLVCFILTIFFLVFGPEMVRAGLRRFGGDRREELDHAVRGATRATQLQVGAALVVAATVGLTIWGVGEWLGAPSPGLFALAGAAFAIVPYVGIFVAFLPVVLVGLGVASWYEVLGVGVLASVLQYVEATRWRPFVDRRSLYVGPAALVISAALGYVIYGFGGMVVLGVCTVFALAVADQVATDDPADPSDPDDAADPIPTPIDEYVEPDPDPESESDPESDPESESDPAESADA
ncbi:MAG: AI-2E family transporter, partial [Ilumatobacteraceae bacterium]